jgi:hypothetical protein
VKSGEPFYGEWEIGTYSAAWRIVRGGAVVCGSSDAVDSIGDLDRQLQAVILGAPVSIEASSQIDVRVELDNGTTIDFFGATSDGDEIFHIFGPQKLYIEYTPDGDWKVGSSNVPWNDK